jgi:hypothetical protein
MGLLREILRHWVPLIVLLPILVGTIFLCVNVGGEVYRQYRLNVAERTDAANRYRLFCSDPMKVYEANYGNDCRKHLHTSQSIPLWDAMTGTAGIYTTLCDPHHGCGGVVVSVLGVVVVVLATALFMACKFATDYRRNLAAFNDRQDEVFFHNRPGIGVDQRPRGQEFPRIVELKQD